MSTTNQIAAASKSNDNFSVIFQVALSEYETVTGKSLRTHPFATQLDNRDTPQIVLSVILAQVEASSKSRKRDEKLMRRLDPVVHILFTFSATLGEGIGLVSRFEPSGVMILFQHLALSHSHLRKRYLRGLVSFSQ